MHELDLKALGVTAINQNLYRVPKDTNDRQWSIRNPMGQHAIACGVDAPLMIDVMGHVGFYCGGMNKEAEITIHGHAGVGVAENMMSGVVWVKGNASESAGATANGGLLVIEGDASSRCGISMKGVDIVVGGSVGHMSAFMAQRGNLVVCGNAGEALGDSIYEARLEQDFEMMAHGWLRLTNRCHEVARTHFTFRCRTDNREQPQSHWV
ncbi:MAG: protein glxC [Actinomycetes bacterium]